jgi:hypothetical protein
MSDPQNVYSLSNINNVVENITSNPYFKGFILLFFVVYGSALGTGGKPPQIILELFKNPLIRVLLLALVAYEINKNAQVAIVIAILFYLTQQYIFKQESFTQIKNLEQFQNMYYTNKFKYIETPRNFQKS